MGATTSSSRRSLTVNVLASPAPDLARLPPLPLYRFSVDQYHRMIAAGILGDEDPVELLEGLIVVKSDRTTAPLFSIRCQGNGSLPLPIYRFSVDQYQRLIDTGILGADDRVELLAGW